MQKIENVAQLETLENMLVVVEVAAMLGVKTGRVHALINQGKLLSRFATPEETGTLVATGRIKGVPGSGIRLVPHYAVVAAHNRRRPGWPRGKARKR